jgi:transcriptional regulator with XRE-family HTH domain
MTPRLIRAFSAAIKSRRLKMSLTQEDLAGRIEIDRPYITALEAGTKQPTISVLWRIAMGLGLTVSELAALVDQRLDGLPAAKRGYSCQESDFARQIEVAGKANVTLRSCRNREHFGSAPKYRPVDGVANGEALGRVALSPWRRVAEQPARSRLNSS